MAHLTDEKVEFLTTKANEVRKDVIKMLLEAGSGHSAGPLGMADIFTAMYFEVLKHDPKNPNWEERDRFVLSNGHICPVQYVCMAHAGYFPKEDLMTLRKYGSKLQGHPHREWLEGIDVSSGPLGSGLSQAVGMALADRIDNGKNSDKWFYCFMGDGELDCGQIWEAAMLAGKKQIHNLIGLIDRNNIQIDGFTEDIMPLEPLREKFESFGWHVLEVDGHNFDAIVDTIDEAKAIFEKPSMIIAHTIPGKGVDFMEREFSWHGKSPNKEETEKALGQLRTLDGKIKSENQ